MRTPVGLLALCLFGSSCRLIPDDKPNLPAIVGTWLVKTPEAPFTHHMFVFHAEGTMLQSNPDAGDPLTSDSNGLGVWVADGEAIKGKFVEVMADRTTHKFVSRGEIAFLIKLSGNALTGTASATFYDAEGRQIKGPIAATLQGQRIVP